MGVWDFIQDQVLWDAMAQCTDRHGLSALGLDVYRTDRRQHTVFSSMMS